MGCSALDCATCCSVFSFTGIIFLLIIGALLQNQPLYIKGPEDKEAAAQGCYQGALIYLGTFGISVAYLIFDYLKNKATAPQTNSSRSSSGRQRTKNGAKYGAVRN